jgi:hypothetical protein
MTNAVDFARLLGGISPTIVGYAAMAVAGVFLIVFSAGILGNFRLPRWLRAGRGLNLQKELDTLAGDDDSDPLVVLDAMPLTARALEPVIRSVMSWLPRDDHEEVEAALDLLGHPGFMRSARDLQAACVLYGLTGFVAGVVIGTAQWLASSAVTALVALPLGLAFLGYTYPRLTLSSRLSARREQMLFEAPYVFDRLSIAVMSSNNSLFTALQRLSEDALPEDRQKEVEFHVRTQLTKVTSVPEGGYLMRELRLVIERCIHEVMPLSQSFGIMARRNADVPLLEQFCNRMCILEPGGLNVTEALRSIGDRATEIVDDLIETRSGQNTALMITPTLIALIGMALVVAGPSLSIISGMF